ncbi:MAG: sigma-54 factor interaction domain-containing protein, partial [Nitrospinota bacterium]|nr:sigma-54 factor interaction domain-containing protein [Nitrospinota bacterium]
MAIKLQTDFYNLIGKSDGILEVFDLVERAADSDSTVILTGESGTGKELIARALHHNSQRDSKGFVPVNCGAIPSELLESELFGHEKGAFTGAMQTRIGRMELADNGTLFLDEIGDMPMTLQVKLLRVLAESEIDRV